MEEFPRSGLSVLTDNKERRSRQRERTKARVNMLQVRDTGRDSWTHILDTPYCSEHNLNIGIYRLARFWIPLTQFLTISRQNSPNIKNVRHCTWTRPVGRAVRGERCFNPQVGKFAYSRAQRDKPSLEKKEKKTGNCCLMAM